MRRAAPFVALALLALGGPPRDPPDAQCLAAVGRGFARVRDAAQLTTELCLRRWAVGRSVAACADSDPLRLVTGARALAEAEGVRRYSDDGARFLDGFERIGIPMLVAAGAVYEGDLALRGARRGSMRGRIAYDFVADRNEGEVVTVLDGRTWKGPRTCYDAGLIPLP